MNFADEDNVGKSGPLLLERSSWPFRLRKARPAVDGRSSKLWPHG